MTSELEPCAASAAAPARTLDDAGGHDDTHGPRALMLAVLEDAVRSLERGRWRSHFRTRRLAAEAEAWIRCDSRDWPFSFANICDVLGFDAAMVRARVLMRSGEEAYRRRTRLRGQPTHRKSREEDAVGVLRQGNRPGRSPSDSLEPVGSKPTAKKEQGR